MKHRTKEQLIAFERRICDIFETGDLPFLIHLSGGNEDQLISIFRDVQPGDWLFVTHRSHYAWLLAGGTEKSLENKIREGKSMFLFGRKGEHGLEVNLVSSSILAGLCGTAAGVALQLKAAGSNNRVWCFVGDGAVDEGHFVEAVQFVHGQQLPCTFIIENNRRSVETAEIQRYPWGRGIQWPKSCVTEYHYEATFPHGGTGTKTWVKFKPEIVEKFVR